MSYFLGFDLSTQQLKVIACDDHLRHFKTYKVDFDEEYKEKYGITKGVKNIEETGEIYAPVAMWIEALQLAFDRMKDDKFPFSKVKALSGSCQQHGSVYWSKAAPEIMKKLDAGESLMSQMGDCFTMPTAPNWQDHSTGPELELFESNGGADRLARVTGSRAHYRFTGPQIRKLATRSNPKAYAETYRISLVSSFLESILCNEIQRLEESDACGMNMYDLENRRFDTKLLEITAGVSPTIDGADETTAKKGVAELQKKLGPVQPIGYASSGTVGPYFQERYGFTADCRVYPFTGDNLATILALPLGNNDILVSMGTSTTVLLVTDQYKPSANYHIFMHPTIPNHYMGMLCYCNGALAREKVRDAVNEKYGTKGWDKFDDILDESKPLSDKLQLGIYFPLGEIIPNAKPCKRWFREEDGELKEVDAFSVEEAVPSIIESQALSCRLRAGPMLEGTAETDVKEDGLKSTEFEKLGADVLSAHDRGVLRRLAKYGAIQSDGTYQTPAALVAKPHKVFYVGGSSKNGSIVKKYCEIFGAQGNYRIDLSDACALGGCYKSLWSYKREAGGEAVDSYDKWLASNYNWDEVEEISDAADLWDEYVDGVAILSIAEQRLEK